MARTALTAMAVRKLKPKSKTDRPERFDALVPGFGVRANSETSKTWIFVFTSPVRRKRVRHSIGDVNFTAPDGRVSFNLEQAREEAYRLRAAVRAGRDPAVEHESKRAIFVAEAQTANTRTFAAAAEAFIAEQMSGKRTARAIEQIVRRELIPRWGERPIADISRGDVKKMIREIARHSKSAAHQAAIYARALFGWAVEQETFSIDRSPCDRLSSAKLIGKLKPRERTLPDSEIRLIWQATEGTSERMYPVGQFVRLLLILGCRRGELAEMTRQELDLAKGEWRLEGSRTKSGRPRLVPLPRLAIEILAAMPQFDEPYLFTTTAGRRPISGFSSIKRALDRRIAELNGGERIPEFRLHDLRRSMRTGLSALPVPGGDLTRELMIGHAKPQLHQIYDQAAYLTEQREGFEQWVERLKRIIEPPLDNVVTLRA